MSSDLEKAFLGISPWTKENEAQKIASFLKPLVDWIYLVHAANSQRKKFFLRREPLYQVFSVASESHMAWGKSAKGSDPNDYVRLSIGTEDGKLYAYTTGTPDYGSSFKDPMLDYPTIPNIVERFDVLVLPDESIRVFNFNDKSNYDEAREDWSPAYDGALDVDVLGELFFDFVKGCTSLTIDEQNRIIDTYKNLEVRLPKITKGASSEI